MNKTDTSKDTVMDTDTSTVTDMDTNIDSHTYVGMYAHALLRC